MMLSLRRRRNLTSVGSGRSVLWSRTSTQWFLIA